LIATEGTISVSRVTPPCPEHNVDRPLRRCSLDIISK
jgi:hypothetical protein